jgi:hypothetical protein
MKLDLLSLGRALVVLSVFACAQRALAVETATLAWSANAESDIVGYQVYYRDAASALVTALSVNNVTSAKVGGLEEGHTYIFCVTALNSSGVESLTSDAVTYFINSPPALAPIPDQVAQAGSPFSITAQAADPDRKQLLTYSLDSGAPAGALLDPVTGTFTWTPGPELAGTSVGIGITVTDNGRPARSASVAFTLAVQSSDSDGDGIPDWYERQIGLNPLDPADGALDSDGDGISNQAEYDAGTDPTDPASLFHILSIQPTGDDVAVQFSAVAGKQYRVEWTHDLEKESAWTVIADQVPGVSPSVTVADPGANLLPGRFYRVTVVH